MSRQRRKTRAEPKYPAQHYQKRLKQLGKVGCVRKNHVASTKNNINEISTRWEGYCRNMDRDALQHIRDASRDDVILFLEWNLDNYASRKKSNITQKFKHWRQLYRKYTDKDWDARWMKEVNDFIKGDLTDRYSLDITTKEKPVMNIDDVYLVLHHHWALDTSTFPNGRQLLQLALLILVSAYTASRPGALVHRARNTKVVTDCALERYQNSDEERDHGNHNALDVDQEDVVETLCYKHITLTLLPSREGQRDLLAMEIDLQFTKGHKRNPKRKIFCLYEVDDVIFDPVLCVIVLGMLDNAFELEFTSVEQLFSLRVDPRRKTMRLRWKKSWEEIPICRQAVPTSYGVQTSKEEPLRYHTFLYYIQRLGFMAGLMKILNPYNIRRGAGEAVDSVATQPLLQQVMGHRDAGVLQAYMNERVQCDVQAAFLGRPSAEALFKAVSHMSRDVDPRAPSTLTDVECDQLKTHPLLVELRERRDALSREVRRAHGTLKKAEATGSKLFALHNQARLDFESAKKRLTKEKLEVSRSEFFDRIETQDARRQLGTSALDLSQEDWKPEPVQHSLERRKVAQLLCERTSGLSQHEKLEHRIQTTKALLKFCSAPTATATRRRTCDRDWGVLTSPEPTPQIVKIEPQPTIVTNSQCIFCLCKVGRTKPFSRARKAREHVEKHLHDFEKNGLIPCPDEYCRLSGTVLFGHQGFKNHVATIHKCFLLPYSL